MLAEITKILPRCPICSQENTFQVLRKKVLHCQSCNANWSIPAGDEYDELSEFKLTYFGRKKQAKPLLKKRKTLDFWANLALDIYNPRKEATKSSDVISFSGSFEKYINKLLRQAWATRESDHSKQEEALHQISLLGGLGRAEIEGIASGIHQDGDRNAALWYLGLNEDSRLLEIHGAELENLDVDIRLAAIYIEMLAEITKILPRCPICSQENTYKVLRKEVLHCQSCKANWSIPAGDGYDELSEFKLTYVGMKKQAKPLLKKRKTLDFWANLSWDIYNPRKEAAKSSDVISFSGSFEEYINKLLHQAWSTRESDNSKQEEALHQISVLGRLGRAEIEGIASGIHQDGDRNAALWYLGINEDSRWLEIYGAELENPDVDIRLTAIYMALVLTRDTGDQSLLPVIIDRMHSDPSVNVRGRAAQWLWLAGPDKRVIEALSVSLQDYESPPQDLVTAGSFAGLIVAAAKSKYKPQVSHLALWSLEKIDDEYAVEILVKGYVNNWPVVDGSPWFEKAGKNTEKYLIEELSSDNSKHRARAAGFLAATGGNSALPQLIKLLSDEEIIVRRNAVYSLGQLGDLSVIGHLEELVNDENKKLRKEAEAAISHIRKTNC